MSLIKGILTQAVEKLSSSPFSLEGLEPLSPTSRNGLNHYILGLGFHFEERTLCFLDQSLELVSCPRGVCQVHRAVDL